MVVAEIMLMLILLAKGVFLILYSKKLVKS